MVKGRITMLASIICYLSAIPVVLSIEILESPSPVEVLQGLPATLICRTSSPYQGVNWYKDGSLINQEDGRCLLLPDGSLFFLNTVLEDTGDYHCAVTDRATVVRSKHARLGVVTNEEVKDILEEKNDDDEVHSLEFSIRPIIKCPENISVELLIDGTGVVSWGRRSFSTGYLVLVVADDLPVSNISVDSTVDTVQLHNLSPSHHYSVQIATLYEGRVSKMSRKYSLYLRSPLTPSSAKIPTQLWVITFLVVIMMVLIIILVMIFIVIKTRRLPRRQSCVDVEYGKSMIQQRHKQSNDDDNEEDANIDTIDHIYDYATSDQYRFSTRLSDISSSDYSQENLFMQIKQPLI